MKIDAPRSRRHIAARTGAKVSLLRSMEQDGLLSTGRLTAGDEVVVRALLWADGARAGNREHERLLAERVRTALTEDLSPTAVLVLTDGQVLAARDHLEALLAARDRRTPVTLLPVGAWLHDLDGGGT